jgi:AcrR family transcriptional regulator
VVHFFIGMPYRPTERTEARKAAARDTILAAALDQVARAGYASASMSTVARGAGVATGTVYRHFSSKTELFAEVFRRASNRELEILRDLATDRDRPAAERVAACVEAFSRRALAGPVLAYAQIAEPVDPAVEAERLTLRRGYRDVFAGLLREGIDAGELPEQDVETVAAGLVGAIGEALVGPLSPAAPGRMSRNEALIASLVQFCLSAIDNREEPNHGRDAARRRLHA